MMTRLGRANHRPQSSSCGPRESSERPGAGSAGWCPAMTTKPGMTYYCPGCWIEVEAGSRFCPHCRSDLAELDQRTWRRKLLGALFHPEPITRQRAAFILGELHDEDALDTLARLLTRSTDQFLCAEIVVALVALVRRGGAVAEAALNHAQQDPSPSVQRVVGQCRNGHE
jgi:hypothetical protein